MSEWMEYIISVSGENSDLLDKLSSKSKMSPETPNTQTPIKLA